jgi:hypothetical protein
MYRKNNKFKQNQNNKCVCGCPFQQGTGTNIFRKGMWHLRTRDKGGPIRTLLPLFDRLPLAIRCLLAFMHCANMGARILYAWGKKRTNVERAFCQGDGCMCVHKKARFNLLGWKLKTMAKAFCACASLWVTRSDLLGSSLMIACLYVYACVCVRV